MKLNLSKLNAYWKNNTLISGSLIYLFGSLLIKGVAFILIPLYTRAFTRANYGTMELINTIMSLLTILVTFGFTQLLYIDYIHLGSDKAIYVKKLNYAFNVLAVPLLLVSGIIIYLLRYQIFAEPDSLMIVIVILTIYATFYQNNMYSILQLDERPKMVTLNKGITALIILTLNIILVKYMKAGIIAVYVSNLFAIFISLFMLRIVDKSLGEYLSFETVPKDKVKNMLVMGFPFIITSLAYFGINGIDRVIIKSMLGDDQLGLYSVGFKFGAMLEPLLIAPILSAYNPHLFKKFSQGNFNMNVLRNSLLVICVFSIVAFIMPFLVRPLIGPAFESSMNLIPYFVMGFGFLFLSQMLSAPLLYFKKKKALVYNVVLSSIVNIILNLVLIRYFEIKGSSLAFLLTNIFWFLITYYQSRLVKKQVNQLTS